jgi:hypothetical protein
VNDTRLTIVMAIAVVVSVVGIFFLLPKLSKPSSGESPRVMPHTRAWVFVDPDTGCEYLQAYNAGFTPRLENQGKHRGCK